MCIKHLGFFQLMVPRQIGIDYFINHDIVMTSCAGLHSNNCCLKYETL